ncbi:plasmid maintenance system killer protein [Fischerella sp.]|jgi:plasmid maintenance system killer protein|uniref:type II toxin-antitoxin system RelE/ParE family toxin n=1 Tax=Fischerella sp. TaxID=1191 RepID=UPI0025BD73D4|nr:plasmid maintenance system killer protein [Fischerella sp.]
MIVSFKDKATEDIFDGNDSKDARKKCPVNLWEVAQRKLDQLNAAFSLDDMKVPPGNRLYQFRLRQNDKGFVFGHQWKHAIALIKDGCLRRTWQR